MLGCICTMRRMTHDDQDRAIDIGQLMRLLLEIKMQKLRSNKPSSLYSQNPKTRYGSQEQV
jgi:hypothetical protein